ncbi:unnamed protein product [Prunus armeniaca]
MTSFIIQGTSKPTPYTREKYPKLSLSPSPLSIFSPHGSGHHTRLRPPGIEEEREGRSKVEGSRSEYSLVRLFAQTPMDTHKVFTALVQWGSCRSSSVIHNREVLLRALFV